jgi:acetyltransferase-like isoleucine patch superfamily enzyme
MRLIKLFFLMGKLFQLIRRIIYKIYREIIYLIGITQYASYGKDSLILHPMRIVNKQCIAIEKNVWIGHYARIEAIGKWRDIQFSPKITIEDNVAIGQGLHLTCANEVIIHEGCSITPYCMITDIDHRYEDIKTSVNKQGIIVQRTEIGRNTFIGTGVKIMAGVTIGEHAVVGANSVVTKSVPGFSVAAGIPARIIKRYNFETNEWDNAPLPPRI